MFKVIDSFMSLIGQLIQAKPNKETSTDMITLRAIQATLTVF
jgi:hypothetical protein